MQLVAGGECECLFVLFGADSKLTSDSCICLFIVDACDKEFRDISRSVGHVVFSVLLLSSQLALLYLVRKITLKGSYKTNFYVIRLSFRSEGAFHGPEIHLVRAGSAILMGWNCRGDLWKTGTLGMISDCRTKIAGACRGLMTLVNCGYDKNHTSISCPGSFITMS